MGTWRGAVLCTGIGLSSRLCALLLSSPLFGCPPNFAPQPEPPNRGGGGFHWIRWTRGRRQIVVGHFGTVTLRSSLSLSQLWECCLLWGEVSVIHLGLTKVITEPLFRPPSTTVPQDLMDVSMNNLPSLWQPSPRKSSCSSCSQSGSADSTNGCNHER